MVQSETPSDDTGERRETPASDNHVEDHSTRNLMDASMDASTVNGASDHVSASTTAEPAPAPPPCDGYTCPDVYSSGVRARHENEQSTRNGDYLRDVHGRIDELTGRHGQWTCFLCCHVRTGTIVIGFWHLLLHLMALSLIAVVIIHPEMLRGAGVAGIGRNQLSIAAQDVQAVNCTEMPCSLAAQGNSHFKDVATEFPLALTYLSSHRLSHDDVNVALFITMCTFVVTLLLVYGAFRGQPSHLMPFFFLQVFDFCISSMTMIGYLSYLPNVRQLIRETPAFPFQSQLLAMNTKCLTFFAMLIFVATFMVKAYCISIVWRCYKFLMLRAQGGRWVLRHLGGTVGPVDQESQTLVTGHDLPDYDTAVSDPEYRKKSSSLFPEPPPSYDMAMAASFSSGRQNTGQSDVALSPGMNSEASGVAPSPVLTAEPSHSQDTTAGVELSVGRGVAAHGSSIVSVSSSGLAPSSV